MALIPFEYNNLIEESEELITTQFQDKDVFRRYLSLLVTGIQETLSVCKDLIQKRDIDSAIGAQLDIIGDIVGQPRVLLSADLYPFFGFKDALAANSFGTYYNKQIGGYWYSYGGKIGGDVTLNDEQYRLIIKARIIKNNSKGTNEDYIKFGNFVFNTNISFDDDFGGKSTVLVGRRMTLFEKAIMGYAFEGTDYNFTYHPKPLGVGIGVEEFDSTSTLGFLGTPRAKGMISLGYPFDGGIFANAYF